MKPLPRPFARVYYDDLMRDYPDTYADDGALATWLRLLVVAEKFWPTAAELPRSVKPRALRLLVDCGLVELVPPHCFRIRGHDAERSRRVDAARNAAALRWHEKGNADSNAEVMPRRDETSTRRDSPSPTAVGQRDNGTNPRKLGTNARTTGSSPRQAKRAGMPDTVAAILRRAAAARSEP